MPPTQAVASALNQMGQLPLMPPNVRGWPGGRMWINTSTLFIRYNTGVWLAGGEVPALQPVGSQGTMRAAQLPDRLARPTDFDPNADDAGVARTGGRCLGEPADPAADRRDKKTGPDRMRWPIGVNTDSVRKVVQLDCFDA